MSDILVKIPCGGWINEKKYVASCVFCEFLNLPETTFIIGQDKVWEIYCNKEKLVFPDLFFPEDTPEQYLSAGHLPVEPYHWIDTELFGIKPTQAEHSLLPVFWYNYPVSEITDIDIFGTLFFYLTRYEEYVSTVRDEENRFPAAQSVSRKAGIIHRPIVDEYLRLLRYVLQQKIPALKLGVSEYQLILSHDVDIPHSWLGSRNVKLLRALARNLIRERSVQNVRATLASFVNPQCDPVFCFDWIMSLAEKYGQRTSFYFLVNATDPHDFSYDLSLFPMNALVQDIIARGHKIGLHGSYNSFSDSNMLFAEKQILEAKTGIQVTEGRQHYLRFEVPTTWRAWETAGLSLDSTLGFAEQAGFRCGTAREYPVFDLMASKVLNLRERPLICMEHTLLHSDYQGLNVEQSYEYATNLIDQIRQYGGNFTLLWHNNNLITDSQRELFGQLIKYAS